jgi:hypothetical protein
MTTKRKIIAIVTSLTVWASIASPALAITADELQAQIDALLAQLSNLQNQLAGMTGGTGTITGCTITSFDRALKQGMSGDDVKCLQIILNSAADTQLAASGVGSSGNETSYFGPLTKTAVIKFQEKYASAILASWGLTSGTGYVGSTTRAKLNELLAGGAGTGGTGGEGGVTPAQAGLTVGLAADTYPQTGIPYGTSIGLFKFTLLSDEETTINSLTIRAGGLATFTNIQSVAIFDENGIRLTTRKNVTSDGYAVFNFSTPLVIAANTLRTFTVEATAVAGAVGQAFYLSIMNAADIISTASEIHGLPVMGNAVNVLGATVGAAAFDAADPASSTHSFGEDDVLAASFDIDVTGDNILFSGLRLKNGGTGDDSVVSNLRLICDGEELATADLVNDYASFSFSSYEIEKNDSASCEVRGDLGTGSNGDTVKLYIKDISDVTMTCKSNGFAATVTTPDLNTAAKAQEIILATGDFTIDFDKSASSGTPKQEVRPDTNNVVIATLKMTSNAENATIESIVGGATHQFEIQGTGTVSSTDITAGSIEMRDVDTGAIYDLAETWVSATEGRLSMTEEISLVAGVTKTFQIRLDLTSSISDGATLEVVLEDGAFTITGDVSDESITDIVPSSITSAKTTIKTSSLTVTTQVLTDVSVVPGAEDIIIYQGTFKAGNSSLATLKTVTISEVAKDSLASKKLFSDENISSLTAYLDGKAMKTVANKISEAPGVDTGMGSITFSSLSENNVVPAGETVTFALKANFNSSLNGVGSFALGITDPTADVIARDVDNELIVEDITSTSTESRTVTLATKGDLKVELKTDDVKANKEMYIVAGTSGPTGRYIGELVFTTKDEPVRVTDLSLTEQNTTTGTIKSVSLVEENGTVVVTQASETNGDVIFEDVDLEFDADVATSLFIMVNTNGINVQGDPTSIAISGDTIEYIISTSTTGVVAEGINSGESIAMIPNVDGSVDWGEWSTSTVTTTEATVLGAAITNVENDMSDGVLTAGAGRTIGKYTLTIDSGDNRNSDNTDTKLILQQLILNIGTSGMGCSISTNTVRAYIEGNSSNKTTAVNATSGVAAIDFTTLTANGNKLSDGEVTVVITATIVTDGDDAVWTEIDNLATDITYSDGANGNGGDCKLTIDEVIGASLSN